ncbi:MAG: S8 family serine peptidase [Planctomycetes bacterium]|nr:S8 family serine peptidase [Planctomycetota bacterium]
MPRRTGNRADRPSAPAFGRPELILVTRSEAGLRLTPDGFASSAGASTRGLAAMLSGAGIALQPLFGLPEDRMRERAASLEASHELPDYGGFYHVSAPSERLEELAASLRSLDEVEGAYVKPAGEPPIADVAEEEGINTMSPSAEEAPAVTPDFTSRQIYLNAAPAGIDARFAWLVPGGRGAGGRIIDCEWGWRFTHEDLTANQGGVVIGVNHTDTNHGTAVLGEFSGDLNGRGVTGICPAAFVTSASFLTLPTAKVIRQAADRLRAGDILLLEIHRPGPGASGAGQDGFIAIEWWPDDLAAIRYAVARGVIVVEAAGNGARNLDHAIYNTRPPGFPATWSNPFNTANPTSGAVLVGAGAPPPGTHGRDHGPDRSRLGFSNHGRRVDAQGWGREVTSTGYGDLQGGATSDVWYTDTFSGTSSASPIVVGALASVQGVLRARSRPLLTPAGARNLLRTTGSPQQAAPGRPVTERIGNRPDLRKMIARVLGTPGDVVDETLDRDQVVSVRPGGQVVIHIHSASSTININGNSTGH